MITLIIVFALLLLIAIASNVKRTASATERMERAQHDALHPDIPPHIVEAAKAGNTIGAIADYRAHTGCSVEIATAKIAPLVPKKEETSSLVIGAAIFIGAAVVIIIAMSVTQ